MLRPTRNKLTRTVKYFFLCLTILFCSTLTFGQANYHRLQSEIDSSQKILLTQKLDTNRAKTFLMLGRLYSASIKHTDALEAYLSGLRILESVKDTNGLLEALDGIANIFERVSKYQKALDYQLRSLNMETNLDNKELIASRFINIGRLYNKLNNNNVALDYQFKGLRIYESLMDKKLIIHSLFQIANSYLKLSDYQNALKYQFRNLKVSEEFHTGSAKKYVVGNLLGTIGDTYSNLGESEKAIDFKLRGLKLIEESGESTYDVAGLIFYLNSIGETFFKQKKFKLALEYSNKANQIAIEKKYLKGQRETHYKLFKIYRMTGNDTKALEHHLKYILFKDSMLLYENQQELLRQETRYEMDKYESILKAEQDKKDVIATEEKQKQKIITCSIGLGLCLVILFSVFIFRSLKTTRRQKIIIEEKQKDILGSIRYAKRIQTSLLPTEKYIDRILNDNGRKRK